MVATLPDFTPKKLKKPTDSEALRIELTKTNISVTNDSLTLIASHNINQNINIATYNDHRMAMAFAPLAISANYHRKQ
jgi:3-phosphoshikimate 1-carboxyvinyltransferase